MEETHDEYGTVIGLDELSRCGRGGKGEDEQTEERKTHNNSFHCYVSY
jgi:hypothetical protein